MSKLTGGQGWAFIPEEGPQPSRPGNPGSPRPKIRVEKRAGKQVTVIDGLHTYGADRLNAIARALKKTCGAGGTVKNGVIEIQGDQVEAVRAWFEKNPRAI